MSEFEKASQLAPPSYELLHDWAEAEDCAGHEDQALKLFQQASEQQPSGLVSSQIGMILAKQGRYKESLDALDKAQQQEPNLAVIYAYRGNIDYMQGEFGKAAEQFQRALSLDPEKSHGGRGIAPGKATARQRSLMGRLRIGVNALYLLPGQVGGTEIYLRQLLAALARIDHENEYVVFTNQETDADVVSEAARFEWRKLKVKAASRPARLLYEQLVLPRIVKAERINVLFNPGFTVPYLASMPAVTVFHDPAARQASGILQEVGPAVLAIAAGASSQTVGPNHRGFRSYASRYPAALQAFARAGGDS